LTQGREPACGPRREGRDEGFLYMGQNADGNSIHDGDGGRSAGEGRVERVRYVCVPES
jgi:hypothetical protein